MCQFDLSASRMGSGGEVVDVVDTRDRRVRTTTLSEVVSKGLLHRAVAVMVFRRGGMLLLQRRSLRDSWHPGRWTLSCTGHVKAGESYAAGAKRELREELGLSGRLTPVTKMFLPKIRSRGWIEWEVAKVYTCHSDLPVVVDKSELERVEGVTRTRLRAMMKGRALTPDAKLILSKCFHLVEDELRTSVSL